MRCFISVFVNLLSQVCGAWASGAKFARGVRILTTALILLYPTYTQGEDWKGIRPLVSTEKDVIKILGECKKRGVDALCEYGSVRIYYTSRTCAEGGEFNVPKGSVVEIGIAFYIKRNADGTSIRPTGTFDDIDFREKLELSDLKASDFELTIDHYYRFRYFKSLKRGIMFATLGSTILQAVFTAPEELKEKLRCPGSTK